MIGLCMRALQTESIRYGATRPEHDLSNIYLAVTTSGQTDRQTHSVTASKTSPRVCHVTLRCDVTVYK